MIVQRSSFIKVCGVTSVEDAAVVLSAGADALGLIFATSPRRVALPVAHEIVAATNGRLLRCAVFRDNTEDFVLEHLEGLGVDAVQVHGPLSQRLLEEFRRRGMSVIKALSIGVPEFWDFDERSVDAVLVDGATPGSGVEHSWTSLSRRSFTTPVIAAGGLGPNNVAGTIAATHVWGVDAASGTERTPGLKDPELVSSFVANAREAFESEGVR